MAGLAVLTPGFVAAAGGVAGGSIFSLLLSSPFFEVGRSSISTGGKRIVGGLGGSAAEASLCSSLDDGSFGSVEVVVVGVAVAVATAAEMEEDEVDFVGALSATEEGLGVSWRELRVSSVLAAVMETMALESDMLM